MKKNNCFGDFIYIVHMPCTCICTLTLSQQDRSVLEYIKGIVVHRCRKWYDDANITLRLQDNKQNCRMIVTWHKYTFMLIGYNNRRAKRAGKFWNAHTKKNTPDNAENLEMLNIVLRDVYFENSKAGGMFRPPYPDTPCSIRAWTHQIQISPTTFYIIGQLCTGRFWTLYNNIHGYLGHKPSPRHCLTSGIKFQYILYVRCLQLVVLRSRSVPSTRWAPYSNHYLSVRQQKL